MEFNLKKNIFDAKFVTFFTEGLLTIGSLFRDLGPYRDLFANLGPYWVFISLKRFFFFHFVILTLKLNKQNINP